MEAENEDADATDDPNRDLVDGYYEALDAGDYDALRELLAVEFVQRRPDRTFEGRDAFVRFMRDDRPRTDTVHAVDAVFARRAGDGEGARELAVRGRLLAAGGDDELVSFVDVFRIAEGRLVELDTYTR